MIDTSGEARFARAVDERRRHGVPDDAPVVRLAVSAVRCIAGLRIPCNLMDARADTLYRCVWCADGSEACLERRRAVIRSYAAALHRGAQLPPILVRRVPLGLDVVDGSHRYFAHDAIGRPWIRGIVVPDR